MYSLGFKHVIQEQSTVPRSTATLLQTGQTTSYRTGDDGDIEAGRATDFLTLDAAPLHNDGSATLNTTTARFTDTLGGSTYADDIVLDWSTWNGSTLLGYRRTDNDVNITWANSIDGALATSIGSFTTGWRLPNIYEMMNICNYSFDPPMLYAPFNVWVLPQNKLYWSGTTNPSNTSTALIIQFGGAIVNQVTKTNNSSYRYYPVRTFSLSTLNVLS